MAKSLLLSLIIILLASATYAQGQEWPEERELFRGVTLFGGAALPVGLFAETAGDDGGFAVTGFTVGGEFARELVPNFDIGVGFCMDFNSFNEDEFSKMLVKGLPQGTKISLSTGRWISGLLVYGMGLRLPLTDKAGFFIHGNLGWMFAASPSVKVTATLGGNRASASEDSYTGNGFAYGGSAGFSLGSIELAIRFYTGEPEFKTANSKLKQTISNIHLTLGVIL